MRACCCQKQGIEYDMLENTCLTSRKGARERGCQNVGVHFGVTRRRKHNMQMSAFGAAYPPIVVGGETLIELSGDGSRGAAAGGGALGSTNFGRHPRSFSALRCDARTLVKCQRDWSGSRSDGRCAHLKATPHRALRLQGATADCGSGVADCGWKWNSPLGRLCAMQLVHLMRAGRLFTLAAAFLNLCVGFSFSLACNRDAEHLISH